MEKINPTDIQWFVENKISYLILVINGKRKKTSLESNFRLRTFFPSCWTCIITKWVSNTNFSMVKVKLSKMFTWVRNTKNVGRNDETIFSIRASMLDFKDFESEIN